MASEVIADQVTRRSQALSSEASPTEAVNCAEEFRGIQVEKETYNFAAETTLPLPVSRSNTAEMYYVCFRPPHTVKDRLPVKLHAPLLWFQWMDGVFGGHPTDALSGC